MSLSLSLLALDIALILSFSVFLFLSLYLFLSLGEPFYQSRSGCEDPQEDPTDRPWGQMPCFLHGNHSQVFPMTWSNPGRTHLMLFYLFSQWQCVLDIISKALFDNTMEFSQINGIHKFQVGNVTLCTPDGLWLTGTLTSYCKSGSHDLNERNVTSNDLFIIYF